MTDNSIYSIGIERVILSSFIFDYELFENNMHKIKSSFFYLPAHQKIFEAMDTLHKKGYPIDEELIRREISTKDVDDSIFIEIMGTTPVTELEAYILEVIESFKRREFVNLATSIKKLTLEDFSSSDNIKRHINQKIEDIEVLGTDFEELKTAEVREKELESKPKVEPIKTHIQWIDSPRCLDGGFIAPQLVFFSGKKEAGKTVLMTEIMENMLINGTKCLFFPYEFGFDTYWENLIKTKYPNAHKDNKALNAIRENMYVEDWETDILVIERKILAAIKKGCKAVFIDSKLRITHKTFKGGLTPMLSDVFQTLSRLKMQHKILIFIIVQMPKEAYEKKIVTVKDCVDADHEASIWFSVWINGDGTRNVIIHKNKQNHHRLGATIKQDPITKKLIKIKDININGEEVDENEQVVPKNSKKKSNSKYIGSSDGIPVYEEPNVTEYEVHSTDETLGQLDIGDIDNIL